MDKFRAYTYKSPYGHLNMLKTYTIVMASYSAKSVVSAHKNWIGLWDTGASNSCITQRIVKDLDLVPIGKKTMRTANGEVVVDTYIVDFGLPNGLTVKGVQVSCCDLGDDVDVLIGMDVIMNGDFAITNTNQKTTFSFRIPSIQEIEYEKELKN